MKNQYIIGTNGYGSGINHKRLNPNTVTSFSFCNSSSRNHYTKPEKLAILPNVIYFMHKYTIYKYHLANRYFRHNRIFTECATSHEMIQFFAIAAKATCAIWHFSSTLSGSEENMSLLIL